MARFMKFTSIVAAAIVLLAVSATAQDGVQPQVSCASAQTINFDAKNISGKWYEVARNPLPPTIFCAEVNVGVSAQDANILQINTTYANTSAFLYINETVTANISMGGLTLPNNVGFNISYFVGAGHYQPNVTYKLLATDYNNYALACGYTNATDNTTEFGVVLTRVRNIASSNMTQLNLYEQMGFNMSTAFLNGSMATLIQSDECWTVSGATTTLPFFSALFALFALLLQYFN